MYTLLVRFLVVLGLAQGALAEVADAPVLEQRTQSFTIALNGSVPDVTPLFGPVHEVEWAPEWSPHFIHPTHGVQREDVVFMTAGRHAKDRLWLLTKYDVGNGQIEYVALTPLLVTSHIKIRVVPDGKQRCKATISYRHSALTPEGNEEVTKLDEHWAEQQRIHWETAINQALGKGRQ
jgi:hypothetical protein